MWNLLLLNSCDSPSLYCCKVWHSKQRTFPLNVTRHRPSLWKPRDPKLVLKKHVISSSYLTYKHERTSCPATLVPVCRLVSWLAAQLQQIKQNANVPAKVTWVRFDAGVILTLQYQRQHCVLMSDFACRSLRCRPTNSTLAACQPLSVKHNTPLQQLRWQGAFLIFSQRPYYFLSIINKFLLQKGDDQMWFVGTALRRSWLSYLWHRILGLHYIHVIMPSSCIYLIWAWFTFGSHIKFKYTKSLEPR